MSDYVPQGANAAAFAWCRAVSDGDFDAAWSLMTEACRRHEAAGWLDRNADDQMVDLYDREQAADDLASLESDHRLRDRMEAELVVGYLGALPDDTSPDDWAAATHRRISEQGFDVVIIVDKRRVPEVVSGPSLLAPEVFVNVYTQETPAGWRVVGWNRHPSVSGS